MMSGVFAITTATTDGIWRAETSPHCHLEFTQGLKSVAAEARQCNPQL